MIYIASRVTFVCKLPSADSSCAQFHSFIHSLRAARNVAKTSATKKSLDTLSSAAASTMMSK